LANRDNPPETKNAAPSAKGNGASKAYETGKFHYEGYTGDAAMRKVEVEDRRPWTVTLEDGLPMTFKCDLDGLVSAYDFLCLDGRLLRMERRLVTVVPPLFYGECAA